MQKKRKHENKIKWQQQYKHWVVVIAMKTVLYIISQASNSNIDNKQQQQTQKQKKKKNK